MCKCLIIILFQSILCDGFILKKKKQKRELNDNSLNDFMWNFIRIVIAKFKGFSLLLIFCTLFDNFYFFLWPLKTSEKSWEIISWTSAWCWREWQWSKGIDRCCNADVYWKISWIFMSGCSINYVSAMVIASNFPNRHLWFSLRQLC